MSLISTDALCGLISLSPLSAEVCLTSGLMEHMPEESRCVAVSAKAGLKRRHVRSYSRACKGGRFC